MGLTGTLKLLCVEVGARGVLHEMAWGRMCGTFGITKGTRKALRNAMQDATIRAAIASFSAATTKSGNLKHYEILGCPLKRATQLHQRWLPLRLVVRAMRTSLQSAFDAVRRVPIKTAALLF